MPTAMRRSALFLDRDGVINVDRGYVHRPDQFEFVPGIFDLARFTVHELGWPIVVVTNQSGIGRGLFDEEAFESLTRWMCDRFEAENAPITRVYHCPYHPQFGIGAYRMDHPWRKPKPGMILQAAVDLDLDLTGSAIIGNSLGRHRSRRSRRCRTAHSTSFEQPARRRRTGPRMTLSPTLRRRLHCCASRKTSESGIATAAGSIIALVGSTRARALCMILVSTKPARGLPWPDWV